MVLVVAGLVDVSNPSFISSSSPFDSVLEDKKENKFQSMTNDTNVLFAHVECSFVLWLVSYIMIIVTCVNYVLKFM